MSVPKFTIVTPSYNQALYLEQTIRSVGNQGFPDTEYLVMDGGSTDNSVEVIKKYPGVVTDWISEKDRGQADAVNKGFRRARGEIVGWLNSDDVYVADAFRNVAAAFDKDPSIDIVYGNCDIIDKNGKVIGEELSEEFDLQVLLLGNRIPQPATFIRRRVLGSLGYLREDLHYSLDYEYWLRCAMAGRRFRHIDVQLASFRSHDASKTETNAARFKEDTFRILEEIFSKGVPLDISTGTCKRLVELCQYSSEPLYHVLYAYRNGVQSLNAPDEVMKRLKKMGLAGSGCSRLCRIVGRHYINACLDVGYDSGAVSGFGLCLGMARSCPIWLTNRNVLKLLVRGPRLAGPEHFITS